jgi:hypothetical protein
MDFLADCCDCAPTLTVTVSDLNKEYVQWAQGHGRTVISPQGFNRIMKVHTFAQRLEGPSHARTRVWVGLRLKPARPDLPLNEVNRVNSDSVLLVN